MSNGSTPPTFIAVLFFLGVLGNFAIFSLWLPELFVTEARATAFAFCTSVDRSEKLERQREVREA
jgi:hypothetical protein